MTPDLQKEFRKLRRDALLKLRNIAEAGSYARIFTLFIEPSFEPSKSFTLYAPKRSLSGKSGMVTQQIWRSDIDGEKFRDPIERLSHGLNDLEPTIESESWEVEAGSFSSINDRLSKIAIPVFACSPLGFGLDGTNYELTSGCFSLKWWEKYPPEWQPLTEAVMDIHKTLTSDGHRPPLH